MFQQKESNEADLTLTRQPDLQRNDDTRVSLHSLEQKQRPPLVQSVSIIVESVDNGEHEELEFPDIKEQEEVEPIHFEKSPRKSSVQLIMDHARLRKEEFARLLEEHAQLVKEINQAENSLL
ncbi:uncharacterized protein LOC143222870 isoform X2 [Tachypleus tridentatus]